PANITTNPGSCNNATSMDAANISQPQSIAFGAYIPEISGVKAKDSGEYGLAYRFGVPKLDTEFGLYAMNIHARIPNISLKFGSFPPNYGVANLAPLAGFWEYPEDMKIYGVSAATTILGWSVSGELSTTRGFPLQTDGNDILFGGFGYGPLAATLAPIAAVGGVYHAGDRINKNQAQINVLQAGNGLLGAMQYLFVGEVGYQWNNKRDDKRYNRNFIFGIGPDPTLGGNTCGTFNRQPDGCSSNEGYVTKNSWGYRLLARLEYPNVYNTGVTVFPMVFYSQDVKGYAADGAFLEDRTTTGLGVRFSYMKKYNLEFNYTTYGDRAKFDPLRDRDYYSANASITF
ncbi:MAG: DUF1302 family protein, partial [Proteobacteria bacterium]|nr:DUF1302 family protein [Pseudomonadota bacterium]